MLSTNSVLANSHTWLQNTILQFGHWLHCGRQAHGKYFRLIRLKEVIRTKYVVNRFYSDARRDGSEGLITQTGAVLHMVIQGREHTPLKTMCTLPWFYIHHSIQLELGWSPVAADWLQESSGGARHCRAPLSTSSLTPTTHLSTWTTQALDKVRTCHPGAMAVVQEPACLSLSASASPSGQTCSLHKLCQKQPSLCRLL